MHTPTSQRTAGGSTTDAGHRPTAVPRLLPPHWFLLALIAMALLALVPAPPLLTGATRLVTALLGVALLTAGITAATAAARRFARAGTSIVPFTDASVLVSHGPFAISRNPMYTGMVVGLAGIALALNSPWPWLVVPALFALLRQRFVVPEERLMEATFGAAWLDYRSRVRRWL